MPIPLGVLAVAGAGAGPVAAGNAYELLETTVVGSGGQADVIFSNLNSTYGSTYQHLQLRMTWRSEAAGVWDSGILRFNGLSTTTYAFHELVGIGSGSPSSAAGASQNRIGLAGGSLAGGGLTANSFTATIVDILDPFETTKNTTIRELTGATGNEYRIRFGSGLYYDTPALTSITLATSSGSDIAQYSRISLYGLRSA